LRRVFSITWAAWLVSTGNESPGVRSLYRHRIDESSWQWFFIIEGGVSILVGVAAFFLLPDYPENTKWLSVEESEMAQYRVVLSNGGKQEEIGGTWDGLKAAVRDPFTWMFCGMHFSLINAQSFKDFFPSVSLPNFRSRVRRMS
jgi:sugar phosphate permease